MRVLFLLNSLATGGAERHAVDLANSLHERGYEVHLIYLHDRHDLKALLSPAVGSNTQYVARSAAVDINTLLNLRRACDRRRPDAVIAVGEYPLVALAASQIARLEKKIPVIALNHTSSALPGDNRLLSMLDRVVRSRCRGIIYITRNQQRYWHSKGIRNKNEWIIPNGVDIDRFSPQPSDETRAHRHALLFSDEEMIVGMCAVLRPEKRHDVLLEAVALTRARGYSTRALLIGDGPCRADVEYLIDSKGLAGAVSITGRVTDPERYVALCDVMCLTSDAETFSLSVLESMAMAKPVAATDVGGNGEQIENEITGLLFPRGDAEALSSILARLHDDPALRSRLGSNGRRRVTERFARATMEDAYDSILSQIASRGPDRNQRLGFSRG